MVPPPQQYKRPLTGKVTVITGASRDVGAELAKVDGREGASFQISDAAVEVVQFITAAEGQAVAYAVR